MVLTDLLEQHISQGNSKLVSETIYEILNVKNKKWILIDFLINLYCRDYINRNIWILKQFEVLLEQIESNRNNTHFIINIASLLTSLDKKPIHLWDNNQIISFNDLNYIVESYNDIPYLIDNLDFDNSLDPTAWKLLNIIYYNLINNEHKINDIFTIIRYFICNKNKKFIPKSNDLGTINLDYIDYLFLLLKYYIDNNILENDILDYIVLSKNLFFYKLKKKYKLLRINIVFYSFYIIITKKIKNIDIIYDIFSYNDNENQKNDKNYDYMFVKLDYNIQNSQIENNIKLNKEKTFYKKKIEINPDNILQKNLFTISKI